MPEENNNNTNTNIPPVAHVMPQGEMQQNSPAGRLPESKSPQQEEGLSKVYIATVGAALLILAVIAGGFFFLSQRAPQEEVVRPYIDSNVGGEYREGTFQTIATLPDPQSLKADTKQEVLNLFDMSRLTYSFNVIDPTVEYLLKILDSDSSEAQPFKAIAGYFLLHIYYDSGYDLRTMVNALERSSFLSGLTVRAQEIYPEAFLYSVDEITSFDRNKGGSYVASYMMALNEQTGKKSLILPAHSADELVRRLITSKSGAFDAGSPNLADERLVGLVPRLENLLDRQLRDAVVRLEELTEGGVEERRTMPAHDIVGGLNHLALAVERVRENGFAARFPVISDLDITRIYETSHAIAVEETPSLDSFTTYLYARHLARTSSEQGITNDPFIDNLVKSLTGEPPFTNITERGWAWRHFTDAKSETNGVYAVESVAAIARKSETLRTFLQTYDGWTEEDFLSL